MMRPALGFVLLASVAVITISACASNPEPIAEPTPVPTAAPQPTATAAPMVNNATPAGPIKGSKADFAAAAADRVYFDYDQFTLDDSDKRALQAQAAWLNQYPKARVQVEGNADERGTREYNIALGLKRAEAVKAYLSSLGVASTRVDTHSWGKERPINTGHDDAAHAQNRNSFTNLTAEGV